MTTVNELTSGNLTNTITNSQTWNGIIYNVKSYGAKGDGSIDDSAKIADAITAASANGGIVYFPPGTYVVGSAITFPSNVTAELSNGAKLSVNTGITVTINGPITAGLYQIFSGAGTITGNMQVPYVVPQWWGAKGDGVTDDTNAFQRSIDLAGNIGGTVLVPQVSSGYIINGSLTVPKFVTLLGFDTHKVSDRDLINTTPSNTHKGSKLLITGGAGTTTGASITVSTGSVVKGITIYYPDQTDTNPPIQYPSTIKRSEANTHDVTIEDVSIIGGWFGIDFSGTTYNCERITIKNCNLWCFNTGISIGYSTDVSRITDVHIWPFFTTQAAVGSSREYAATNGKGIEINRADWLQIEGLFVLGMRYGLYVNNVSGFQSNFTLTRFGFDRCQDGIYMNGLTMPATISNGKFGIANNFGTTANAHGLTFNNCTGVYNISNCEFWDDNTNVESAVWISNKPVLNFTNCWFDITSGKHFIINSGAVGTVASTMNFTSCYFDDTTGYHVVLSSLLTSGVGPTFVNCTQKNVENPSVSNPNTLTVTYSANKQAN